MRTPASASRSITPAAFQRRQRAVGHASSGHAFRSRTAPAAIAISISAALGSFAESQGSPQRPTPYENGLEASAFVTICTLSDMKSRGIVENFHLDGFARDASDTRLTGRFATTLQPRATSRRRLATARSKRERLTPVPSTDVARPDLRGGAPRGKSCMSRGDACRRLPRWRRGRGERGDSWRWRRSRARQETVSRLGQKRALKALVDNGTIEIVRRRGHPEATDTDGRRRPFRR